MHKTASLPSAGAVRKMLSPKRIGVEHPFPGNSAFHFRCFASTASGKLPLSILPCPCGPRQALQSRLVSAKAGMHSSEETRTKEGRYFRCMVTIHDCNSRQESGQNFQQYTNNDTESLLTMFPDQSSQIGKHFRECHPPGQSDVPPLPLRIEFIFILPQTFKTVEPIPVLEKQLCHAIP